MLCQESDIRPYQQQPAVPPGGGEVSLFIPPVDAQRSIMVIILKVNQTKKEKERGKEEEGLMWKGYGRYVHTTMNRNRDADCLLAPDTMQKMPPKKKRSCTWKSRFSPQSIRRPLRLQAAPPVHHSSLSWMKAARSPAAGPDPVI